MREERAIFNDLSALCISPGYVHVVAFFCFRDNMIGYTDEIKTKDMEHLFATRRLVRTEITTLIGLLIKNKIDHSLPSLDIFQEYVDTTEALLEEMHHAMANVWAEGIARKNIDEGEFDLFSTGSALREPIFYGGESAYSFQYRDIAPAKYANDDAWIKENKGFTVGEAREVVYAIGRLQGENVTARLKEFRSTSPEAWTILPGFKLSIGEVAKLSGLDLSLVERVMSEFSLPDEERNGGFCSLHDFNIANVYPLLRLGPNEFLLFQMYSILESLYDSPFYWMGADKAYESIAMQNRGYFTENFSRRCLERVFGVEAVFSNVNIVGSKGNIVGEIDVLVVFGDRAIVLQAKSKRLTLESRRGNDGRIKDDFKKSVQDSYDQGFRCTKLLGDSGYKLIDASSKVIEIGEKLSEIYIFCVVADHYPALAFQSQQFLKFEKTKTILPPFVMDIFTLDAMTEMLSSPLYFLSYVNRRAMYFDKLKASQELTILSYHLKNNLWISGEFDVVTLSDDISIDLDLAMTVRRNGVPGNETPDGILTRIAATSVGRILSGIEASAIPSMIDFGFQLLTLSEDTVIELSNGIDRVVELAKKDNKNHDVTVGVSSGDTGFTFHCNNRPLPEAAEALQRHCLARKYTQRAKSWFGVCLQPIDGSPKFGLCLNFDWEQSDEMDVITKIFPKVTSKEKALLPVRSDKKIGRNEQCFCGSGKKYKRCCLQ